MKTKHNKKRNTAVLYELLVRELTKCVVEDEKEGKKVVLSTIKEHFKKGTVLAKELELYKTLNEAAGMDSDTARRLLNKVLQEYDTLDLNVIFAEQTKLLKKMNTDLPKSVFTNFIPSYKSLASISQMFAKTTPVKDRFLLENQIVENLSLPENQKGNTELKVIDSLTYKTFVNKFNKTYGQSLLPEQKNLVSKYVMSFSDQGASLKLFLNEEIGRLKDKIKSSLEMKEMKEDEHMMNKTKLVLERIEEYKTIPIDEQMVKEILNIQNLIKEIEN